MRPLDPHTRRQSNATVSPLSARRWALFLDVGARIVPALAELDVAGRAEFVATVEKALLDRPPAIRRRFGLFLSAIAWGPLFRFGAPFARLTPERKDAVLRWLMDAPVGKIRNGFWGVRTLVFMGFYGRPEVWPAVGYAPSFDGNELLHG